MTIIERKTLSTIDGFGLEARLLPDPDASPHACLGYYDSEAVVAWHRGHWRYVTIEVAASKAGIVLGAASLSGCEYGSFPVDGEYQPLFPLDGDDDDFANGYGPELIAQAISEAKVTLAQLHAHPLARPRHLKARRHRTH